MIVPEVFKFARTIEKLLEEAIKSHGYFTFTSSNQEHREIRYTEMEFTDLNDVKFYVYILQDPISLNVFAEYRQRKAKKNMLFSGKVVPVKFFENTNAGKEAFVDWIYDTYTTVPVPKVQAVSNFFGARNTARAEQVQSKGN